MNMTPMPQESAAEIARMNRYIQKTKGAEKTVYDMTLKEMGSLREMTERIYELSRMADGKLTGDPESGGAA